LATRVEISAQNLLRKIIIHLSFAQRHPTRFHEPDPIFLRRPAGFTATLID
jgi:hypothetical protein